MHPQPSGLQSSGFGCTYQANHSCPWYNYNIATYGVIKWRNLLQTVMDYMYKSCKCSVNSPKHYCFYQKVCKLKLPTMDEVAIKLKMKYEQSTHSMILPSSGQRHPLVVDRENQRRVHPERMIYFSHSPDYCAANPAYNISGIAGRECVLNDSSLSHHCNNLCCDHGYQTRIYRTQGHCECKFIWCCRVECKACYKIKNRCKNKPDIISY